MAKNKDVLHPGIILRREILEKLGMSQNYLAHMIHVPANRIHDIVRQRRSITADTDIRLCQFFGLPEGYWLRLQNAYDLAQAHGERGREYSRIEAYKTVHNASSEAAAAPAPAPVEPKASSYDVDDVL